MLPWPDIVKLGGIVAVMGWAVHWYRLVKSNARKDVIIETNDKNYKMLRDHAESMEKINQLSDRLGEEKKNSLRALSPADPKWDNVLHEVTVEMPDPTHGNQSKLDQSGDKDS